MALELIATWILYNGHMIVCSILVTLLKISKSRILPSKLLLQMDNCTRENKNKSVFGFFSFSEIEDICRG